MKKAILLLAIAFSVAFTFSSCQKCTVCTATVGTEEVVEEFCGSDPDVEDFEKFWVDSLTELSIPAYCERGPNN